MQIEFRQQQKLVGIAAGCISHLVLVFYPLVFPATHTIKKREKNKVHFSISADATRPRTHSDTQTNTANPQNTERYRFGRCGYLYGIDLLPHDSRGVCLCPVFLLEKEKETLQSVTRANRITLYSLPRAAGAGGSRLHEKRLAWKVNEREREKEGRWVARKREAKKDGQERTAGDVPEMLNEISSRRRRRRAVHGRSIGNAPAMLGRFSFSVSLSLSTSLYQAFFLLVRS